MSSQLPDYKKTYFPYPDLDRIHGQPTIHQLVKVFKQLKQNAASVSTSLAGGQHGFLPLVLTEEQWRNIPNSVAFDRPANPGPFQPRQGRATNAEIALDKARWEARKQEYNTCQYLEATLRNQLEAAFDYEVLDGLRDRVTNTVQTSIPNIINYLFEEYGELSPDQLFEKEDEVKNFVYDPNQPVSVVFNEIINLQDLFELTGSTLNESTMVRLGYVILNRARIFKEYLLSWNNKRIEQQTWMNFQTHFCKAYRDLKKVNAFQIKDSTLNHAAIIDDLKSHQEETMMQMADTLKNSIYHTINHISEETDKTDNTKKVSANAATTNTLKQEIQELREMIKMLVEDKKQKPSKLQKKPRQYCWTHGWCAHNGTQCQSKAVGHQDTATLTNRMGGSDKNCPSK